MTIFERIIRTVFGGQPRSSSLHKLFLEVPDADVGIVLEETGFPYGGVTTYAWWKSSHSAFFKKTHRSFIESEVGPETPLVVQKIASRFDELLTIIERFGVTNYSRNVRDGVVYRLAWGTKDNQRSVTLANPLSDSMYFDLLTKLKKSEWKIEREV